MLRIKGHSPTVAMFKGEAYEWNGAAIRGIALEELYRRYILRSGQQLHEGASSDPVTLVYGDLSWPLHPPSVLKLAADLQFQGRDHSFASFDDQWRAMVWRDRLFVDRKGTNGAVCSLTTRPRHLGGARQRARQPDNLGADEDGGGYPADRGGPATA